MDKSVVFHASLILLGTFISAISQVMLKFAARKHYDSVIKEYMNPLVIIAYTLFVGTTFLSILAYRGIPLSMGGILEATSYFYITFFGVTIFKEKINLKKLLSLLLIVCGIVIYSFFGN